MPDFRIRVDVKDVARGDAEKIAQDIWDREADTLDPGDLTVSILEVSPQGAQFDTNWEPDTAEGV